MNTDIAGALKLASDIVKALQDNPQLLQQNEFLVCPPYPYLAPVQTELSMAVTLGAQDCSSFDNGAYTGDISAEMLKDLNCEYVILGHSERRSYYGESSALIRKKAQKANHEGLKTIICVGETEDEREQGIEKDVVAKQLAESLPEKATAQNTVIAYEPVWAIGTGKVATTEDIAAMHAHIHGLIPDGVRILYGGSVKPANAAEIFAVENVNGALIGGASLKAEDFIGIAQAI